ncbi:MAG: hypothetical protein ACWGOV_00210 [Acidiferrobacterales bacterium]
MNEIPFDIPREVRWVAQDRDGTWWGYTVEPLRNDSGWYENEVGEHFRLGQGAPIDWENSLRKVG